MRTSLFTVLAAAVSLTALASPAAAQERHWHGDIRSFHEHDFGRWRGGNWYHGFHGGRGGWWWIVDGSWYFYPAPVYPYPDPYTPPGVVEVIPPATVAAPPTSVYYCADPAGYYPYVPTCFTAWRRMAPTEVIVTQPAPVMAAPPPVAAPVMAPAPAPMSSRELDDRQLNALSVEFQTFDYQAPKARTRLKNLEKRVESFRQALYTRPYNVIDIVRDADGLEHRIAARREQLH